MATKLEGGGGKALVAGTLKNKTFLWLPLLPLSVCPSIWMKNKIKLNKFPCFIYEIPDGTLIGSYFDVLVHFN